MIRYRAAWVVPIARPPIRDGWVDVEDGRVVAAGSRQQASAGPPATDLGDVAVLPGLVNAHTHLELTYLRGAVPAADEFVTWIRGVMAARRLRPDPVAAEILEAVRRGIAEASAFGTALVGDISNTLVTYEPLARGPVGGVLFYELIKFNAPDPEGLVERACRELDALPPAPHVLRGVAAHAPYSVSPRLFDAIHAAARTRPQAPWSVHLSESDAEVEFIRGGGGPWRDLLEQVGSWDPSWTPPGVSPVEYLDAAGLIDERMLAVHGVQMTDSDLARLARRNATVVACPRSNLHTGAGIPPIQAFYRSGVRVAVGTDSLASTPDLNVFAELAAMRAIAPSVPASSLLDSATRQGARALGFDSHGTIEPGATARLVTVAVPPGTSDVEEYLVSGIDGGQVRWLGGA